jgi:hypothetical protein
MSRLKSTSDGWSLTATGEGNGTCAGYGTTGPVSLVQAVRRKRKLLIDDRLRFDHRAAEPAWGCAPTVSMGPSNPGPPAAT